MDYEEMILARQESEADDCAGCEYKENCHNQCMKIRCIYNPNLRYGGLIMYTEPKVNHYKLIDYFDVWGNATDGWEVNDVTTVIHDIAIAEDATDEEIIDYLIQLDYLCSEAKENVHLESYDNEMIEIVQTKDDYPLGRLEMIV